MTQAQVPVPPNVVAKQASFLRLVKVTPGIADWEASALGDALGSSLKRNPTYAKGVNAGVRATFRQAWREELLQIVNGYLGTTKDRAGFEDDVKQLKETLDARFGHLLQPTRKGYPVGFRIAHAQKSLSLLLKHAWCHALMGEPPACPVDRLILTAAEAPEAMRAWTKVNSMADYLQQLGFLDSASQRDGMTVATWELLHFK